MALHEGEVAVQRRAGITRNGLGSASMGVRLPDVAREFLSQQRVLVVGARDDTGATWASALYGPAGFVRADGERTVTVCATPPTYDPLAHALDHDSEIGLLAIEPASRRRMRVNGRVRRESGLLVVTADQIFANCPKYIKIRTVHGVDVAAGGSARRAAELSRAQTAAIAQADTFFIATQAAGHGADVSHRGGSAGFVTVSGSTSLSWPEYRGNSMFMTLGNLALDPACGLLFPDWDRGLQNLHVTGQAHIDWDPGRVAAFPGAERIVDFEVDSVIAVTEHQPTL